MMLPNRIDARINEKKGCSFKYLDTAMSVAIEIISAIMI